MASCNQIEDMLQTYLDGELGRVERLLLEEHVEVCPSCRQELQRARACAAHLYETLHRDRRTVDLVTGVMAHLPEMKSARRTWRDTSSARSASNYGKQPLRNPVFRYMPVYVPALLFILALLLWMQWPERINEQADSVGVVTYTSGTAYLANAVSSRSSHLKAGALLAAGDTLDTAENGQMLLALKGPTHLAVYGNSSVCITSDRQILMDRGRMFLDVFRDSRRFTITTPHGCITVMGTSFQVGIEDSRTVVSVVNGDVLVENDHSFARLTRGKQAVFQKDSGMRIASLADVDRFVEEARALTPDIQAERFFRASILPAPPESSPLTGEQVFVVKTRSRNVKALLLRWVPDPYLAGHAAYTVYISDNAMRPVSKYTIIPHVFQEKHRNTFEIRMPEGLQNRDLSVLHVTVLPVQNSGHVETSFTEVLAVGAKE
ncbi:MAG TPA: FecR domain-containing protein [Candidatus Hydrogenedentes bacterium]|nr:FecR domain-containing protein [Candidatus Hydrogenedentota bacterium]